MRLHAEHNWGHPLVARARISLNGRLIHRVIMADEERGVVLVWDKGFQRVRKRGTVRIIDPLDWDIHAAYTRCDRG